MAEENAAGRSGSGKQPGTPVFCGYDTAQDREVSKVDVRDVRDLIICKQTRYIESLQRQIDELRLQLAQQTKSNDIQ